MIDSVVNDWCREEIPMANLAGSSSSGTVAGASGPSLVVDPYCVSVGELCTGKSIVKRILVGRDNYISWRKAMELALSGRSQLGFIRGEYPKPEDSAMLARWQRCNDIVMSWLISSVTESIGEHVMRCKDVMTAWNSLRIRYGGTNLARKSVLTTEISNCVQGDKDVATFFDKLSKYWEELDSIKRVKSCVAIGSCSCCQESDDEAMEDRVVKFLVGLNDSFGVVRSNIFAKEEVPHIDKVYEIVSQEELQRSAKGSVTIVASAMYGSNGVQSRQNNGGRIGNGAARGRPRVQCSHCHMLGHTKETCYKLIGYPSGWKSRDGRLDSSGKHFNANNVAVITDVAPSDENTGLKYSYEQVEQACQLLNLLKSGNMPQCNTQMAGIICSYTAIVDNKSWMIDSGATSHFTNNADLLDDIHSLQYECIVKLPNGVYIPVTASGTCHLNKDLVLRDVLLVPEFTVNLISVNRLLMDNMYTVKFTENGCIVQDHFLKTVLETGRPEEGLYTTKVALQPKVLTVNEVVSKSVFNKNVLSDFELWHSRLGHVSDDVIKIFLNNNNKSVQAYKLDCLICPLAKQSELPFLKSYHATSEIFELVHGDVWGPFGEETMTGCKYFLTLVDDFSRITWAFLMRTKSETISHMKIFVKMVETQFGRKIKMFRTDNGGEFFSKQMDDLLQSIGCIHQSSCPHTPQQNGIVERKHRHLLHIARALMLNANLPKTFWGDGILTATYIINKLPTPVLNGATPWEVLFQQPAYVDNLKVFGCLCFVNTITGHRDKFDPRALPEIFLGYPAGQKGYKIYLIDSGQTVISRHVRFKEHIFPYARSAGVLTSLKSENSEFQEITEITDLIFSDISKCTSEVCTPESNHDEYNDFHIINDSAVLSHEVDSDFIPEIDGLSSLPVLCDETIIEDSDLPHRPVVRRSARSTHPPTWTNDFLCDIPGKSTSPHSINKVISYANCTAEYHQYAMNILNIKEPTTFKQASKDSKWLDAMQLEIDALEINNTWIITQIPENKTIVDCKWVYKVKFNADGSVERYKARLVARGYTQIEGLDYHETFAPVAKMTTV